jgi:hypothetical protein
MSSDDGGADRNQAQGSNAYQVESEGDFIQVLSENQIVTDTSPNATQETQEKVSN